MEQTLIESTEIVDIIGITTNEWFELSDFEKHLKLDEYGRRGQYSIPAEEIEYIQSNLALFGRFIRESQKLVKKGRKHYSHITILEYIRHETTITGVEDGTDWKINNDRRAYIGRMAVNIFPAFNGLFNFRESRK